MRIDAAYALGEVHADRPEVVTALLVALAKDPSLDVRRSAASSLGQLGLAARKAVPALARALDADPSSMAWVVPEALGRIGGPEALAVLKRAQRSGDEDVRSAATKAIMAMQTGSKK